jgi:undecaprenyl-diphosphatase
VASWRQWIPLRKLDRRELAALLIGLSVCFLLWGFLALASEVMEGTTTALDARILVALRQPGDLSKPIGPAWVESVLLDLTAVGSPTVLGLIVLAVAGFMLVQQRYHSALVILFAAASGELTNWAFKNLFDRPRPTIVPHLREVLTPSFPSGHAMESAIIYLTLGAMVMRMVEGRLSKLYCMGMAILLTVLAGLTRVFLGVHYPTDVLGGWMLGFLWASVCWLVAQHFESETGVREERARPTK